MIAAKLLTASVSKFIDYERLALIVPEQVLNQRDSMLGLSDAFEASDKL